MDFELINIESHPHYREYWQEYHRLTERRGVSVQYAKIEMRRRGTGIGAMAIHRGEADGMLCGTFGTHDLHLHYVDQVLGRKPGVNHYYAMNVLILPKRTVFICDTYVNFDPTAEQIAEMTVLAAEEIRRFGITPAGGAAVALELRHERPADRGQDAPGAGADRPARARPRGRGRDARRRGAVRGRPRATPSRARGSRARRTC